MSRESKSKDEEDFKNVLLDTYKETLLIQLLIKEILDNK